MKTIKENDICQLIMQKYHYSNIEEIKALLHTYAAITPSTYLYFIMRPHQFSHNDKFQNVILDLFNTTYQDQEGIVIQISDLKF